MKVTQIFYGRGDSGYDILASSIPSCGLTDQVLDLCQSIGTPGFERSDDSKPFLLQKVNGDNVLMACGRNGAPDSLGRKTLFFHVLIIPFDYAKEHRISAYDLYSSGLFSQKCEQGTLSDVSIDSIKDGLEGEGDTCYQFPAVFRCRRATNLDIISRARNKLVCCNWATISWSILDGFDWYGIDEAHGVSSIPKHCHVYDSAGKLQRDVDEDVGIGQDAPRSVRQVKSKIGTLKIIPYCLAGLMAGLCIGRAVWFDQRREDHREVETRDEIEKAIRAELRPIMLAEAKNSLRAEIENEVRKEAREYQKVQETMRASQGGHSVFDETFRIGDYKKTMKQVDDIYVSAMIDNAGDPSLKPARDVFKKLEYYVEFVNANFGNKQKEKK